MKGFITLIFFISSTLNYVNAGTIKGILYEEDGKTPISFATIAIKGTSIGTNSDLDGFFTIDNLKPGNYTIMVTYIGYQDFELSDLVLTENTVKELEIILKAETEELPEITIAASQKGMNPTVTSSLHTLSATAIQQGIGSANDVMQTIQAFPGMATPVGFSNEIMIRGGASIENSYFLEGIEIPLINHFSSQGSSNGIRSILNNAVLKSANIYTSAFPLSLGNTLSGVFDFSMHNGNAEKLKTNVLISTTDASVAINGPFNKYATYNIVFRQSYLKPTLKFLDRPLLATYNDWQYKVHWNLGGNNSLSFIGIGNTDKKEKNSQVSPTTLNTYLLDALADGQHWHMTNAFKFQNFRKKSHTTIIISSSDIFFNLAKNKNKQTVLPFDPISDYTSRDHSNQFMFKNTTEWQKIQLLIGGNFKNHQFHTNSSIVYGNVENNYKTSIQFKEWTAFSEINHQLSDQFNWKIGLKIMGNDYANHLKNPLKQLAPSLSLNYQFNKYFSANAHAGIYHQLPAKITLSHRNLNGKLSNQDRADYFSARHFNFGLSWSDDHTKRTITLEAFHKKYTNYPFSINDQVVLANKGDGFRTTGEEAILLKGVGRAYGVAFNIQQDLFKSIYGNLNYSLSKSEFLNEQSNQYTASAMDARHILNLTIGAQLKNDWHFGIKGRFQTGLPYTPFDLSASSKIESWNPITLGIKDYAQLNQLRLANNFGIDLRIDKTFSKKNCEIKVYADLMDVFHSKVNGPAFFNIPRNNEGFPIVDSTIPTQYKSSLIDNELAAFIPTIGLSFNF